MRIGIRFTFLLATLFAGVGGRSVIAITLACEQGGTGDVHFTILCGRKLIKYLFASTSILTCGKRLPCT